MHYGLPLRYATRYAHVRGISVQSDSEMSRIGVYWVTFELRPTPYSHNMFLTPLVTRTRQC